MGDFCYSRPMLDHVLAQADLMDRMIDRVGVNPAVVARLDRGMTWYAARTRCIECSHSRECRAWVDGTAAGTAPPDFCPNGKLFESCQSEVLRDRGLVPTD
jgi:Family of unknown function (DUF6455)